MINCQLFFNLTYIKAYIMKVHGHVIQLNDKSFIQKISLASYTVTGDANFSIESASLTVGGFSPRSVARALIEQPGSTEIGLAQRIL